MKATTNLLDRAIGFFSPQRGLVRARARAAGQTLLAYEGGKVGRRTDGWVAADTSANGEIGPALSNLRKRSRDLVRNNSYAARAVTEIVEHAVGTSIPAQSRAKGVRLSKTIDAVWEKWVKECDADGQLDFYGLQDLIARTIIESGECIVRHRARRPEDGFRVPYQVQVLEPDYLAIWKTQVTDTGYILQGVEFDSLGRRIAYWLYPNHPGDILQVNFRNGLTPSRVPASEVLHVYRKQRPGQIRGVPWLAPVIMKLRDLDEYEEAELVRKKIEACFAAFVTQPEGPDGPILGAAAPLGPTGNRIETFEPGMIEYLKAGEDIKFNTPSGSGGYGEYVSKHQATVATGVGLTYEQLTGDLSRVNYSSYRAGLMSFRNGIESFRWKCFIPMCCTPIRNRFLETALAAGEIPSLDYATEWTPPSFGSVDPYKDAQAANMDIRSGRKTWEQAVAELGYDPVAQLDAIQRINAEFDKRGITLDIDPRKVNQKGLGQLPGGPDDATIPA